MVLLNHRILHPGRLDFSGVSCCIYVLLLPQLLRGQYQPPPQPTAGQGQGQVPGFTDEVFSQLVQGISTYLTQAALGQQPTETITDFLSSLGQTYDIGPGEGELVASTTRIVPFSRSSQGSGTQ